MDAATIEQMNKVRVSLGMTPLPVPGSNDSGLQFKATDDNSDSEGSEDLSTLDKRQAAAGGNWQRLEAERADKLERQKRKDAAKRARDAAQRFTKLEGKGLGDADEGEGLDTRAWLLQQKRRQKQIDKTRKLQEELAAREQQAEYSSKDLAGVKVGHEVEDFDEITGEQILTLKDAEIGEESEDDELENADLKAKEKLEENLRLKKKRPDYDPTEQGEQQNILSKYDEEISGKKQKQFALDGLGTSAEAAQRRMTSDDGPKSKGVKISLDMFQDDAPVSDYVDPSTIKVKKPKKKKEKKTRQKAADEDDIIPPSQLPATAHDTEGMDVDDSVRGADHSSRKRTLELDDEDLQTKLAEQRRQALKKRKKLDAAEVARQLREEMSIDGSETEDGGLMLDETTEFIANLRKPEMQDDKSHNGTSPRPVTVSHTRIKTEVKDEDPEDDTEMAGTSYAGVEDDEEQKERFRQATSASADMTATGLEEEDTMAGHGLGASLAMLRKRGLISDPTTDAMIEKDRQRTQFLAEKKHLIDEYDHKAREQREADRRSGRWDKMTNRDRDAYARQQNEARELYISRLLAEKFNKEYKPDVQLRYNDEFGRSMSQKEAFKHLSHMFHGKGSGKQKTEKRLKKIEDEKKNMAKGILNISEEGGMMNVQGREGKRQKTAGVRLQ